MGWAHHRPFDPLRLIPENDKKKATSGLDLTGTVAMLADLKVENDRLRRENDSLRSSVKGDLLSAQVCRFFIDCISRGQKDHVKGMWLFSISDIEFAACSDWEVRRTIAALLAEATKGDQKQ